MKIFKVWSSVIVLFALAAVVLSGCSGDDATVTAVKPAAPTGVTATPGDAQATIAWTSVAGATSYNIYWATATGVTPATGTKITGATNPYTQTGLTNGTTCYYVVTAVNAAGESAASSQASATPAPPLPAAPTGVTATPGDTQVTIAWTTVAGPTSYNIYWSTTAGAGLTGTKITGAANPYIQTGLTNATTYYYVVTAVNAAGESAPSVQVSAIPLVQPAPAAPTGVTATAGDGQVTLAWTAVPNATKYNIYYATAPGVTQATGTKLTDPDNASPFIVTPLTNGTTYYLVVTAEGQGESTESFEVSATPSAAPPAAPFIQAIVLSSPGGVPLFGWLQEISVYTDSTQATPITNATVTVNGTALTYVAANQSYQGTVAIAAGAAANLSVTVAGTAYTASGTQYTTFPGITAPLAGATWQAASANTVTWTAGAPTAGSSYLVGVLNGAGNFVYPAGDQGPLEVPTTSTTNIIPANSLTAGSYQVIVGIGTAGIVNNAPGTGITIPNAAAGSALWLGGVSGVPITVQ